MDLPAISLWQPYASLIFTTPQLKGHETRSWAPPRDVVGGRVVVHAAKRPIRAGEADHLLALGLPRDWWELMPYGAALGTVHLEYARRIEMPPALYGATPSDEIAGDWTLGRWIWRCGDPRPFARPIPTRGRQGFWTFNPETAQ